MSESWNALNKAAEYNWRKAYKVAFMSSIDLLFVSFSLKSQVIEYLLELAVYNQNMIRLLIVIVVRSIAFN